MVIKRPMTGALAAFILGELLCVWAGFPILMIVFMVCAVILAVLMRRKKLWRGYYFLVFFLILGYFRMQDIQKASQFQTDNIYQVAGKVDKVIEKDGYSQFYLYDAAGLTKDGQINVPGVILNVSEKNMRALDEVLIGDEVIANISLKQYDTARNPGNFDAKRYYETMNIVCYGWCDSITVLTRNKNPLIKGIFYVKRRLKAVYEQIGTDDDKGVYQSLILGDKSALDTTVKELYRVNGIAHILAISGLHISILGMGLYRLLRRIYVPFSISFLVSGFVMVSYAVMTGNSVSTMRALIMFLVCTFADVLGKTYDSISALALAAMMLLISYPKMLWNTGFLLSFLAVAGVVVVKPAVAAVFGNPKGKVLDGFFVSFSVTVTTLPVLLCAYYETAVYAVFLNLLIIPLMTLLMVSVVFAGLAGLFSMTAAVVFVGTGHYILRAYRLLCEWFQKFPGTVLVLGKPEPVLIVLYYLVLFGFVFVMCGRTEDRLPLAKLRVAAFGAALIVCAGCMGIHFRPAFFVRMLDVGQGDAIHIYADGGHVLIDGGSSDVKNVGAYRILPYLKSQGVRRIRYMVLTHADYDHYGGLLEILEDKSITVDCLLLSDIGTKSESYRKVERAAVLADVPVRYVHAGTAFSCGKAEFTALYPEEGVSYSDENDYSMVLELAYGMFRALFTGDIGAQGEERMLDAGVLGDVDLLKAAHHGSKYSTCGAFLETITPKLALISCGKDNSYGHPHDELLQRLGENNIHIRQTPLCGAVTVTIADGAIKVASYCKS